MNNYIFNSIAFSRWAYIKSLFIYQNVILCLLSSLLACSFIQCFLISNAKSVMDHEREWSITFYTGSKIWSGTDSIINAQIYGTSGKTEVIQFIPSRLQMEARSVDTFSLAPLLGPNLDKIGHIQSITVSKQHSYAFFNDWELLKIELTDPSGKVYLFECRCWLTTLKYKRNIELHSINGVRIQKDIGNVQLKRRHNRIFPITISLLFLLMMLIIFTYFGNLVFKKWRENSHYFSRNISSQQRNRRNRRSRGIHRSTNLNESSANNHIDDLYKDDDDDENNRTRIYNFTNDLSNLNANNHSNRVNTNTNNINNPINTRIFSSVTNEDKPPDYKELYPLEPIVTQPSSNSLRTVETEITNASNKTSV